MNGIEMIALFIALPAITLTAFIVCLCVYLSAKKKVTAFSRNKEREKLKNLKTACLVTGIISAVFVSALILLGIMGLMIIVSM